MNFFSDDPINPFHQVQDTENNSKSRRRGDLVKNKTTPRSENMQESKKNWIFNESRAGGMIGFGKLKKSLKRGGGWNGLGLVKKGRGEERFVRYFIMPDVVDA